MLDLANIRDQIDEIDDQILTLFEKRMQLTEEVAEFKIQTGKPVFSAVFFSISTAFVKFL